MSKHQLLEDMNVPSDRSINLSKVLYIIDNELATLNVMTKEATLNEVVYVGGRSDALTSLREKLIIAAD